jgi:hydrogenase expression/formation protein HypD
MRYVDEFRDRAVAAALAERIKKTVRRPWTIMEVCGGQTHAIVRFGLDRAHIGVVTDRDPPMVVLRTVVGTHRVLDLLSGEQLPRIC